MPLDNRQITSDWKEIPIGICLIRMFHERTMKHCLHLHLKINDRSWEDQPDIPTYSQEATEDSHHEFWQWAEANLPIFDYPNPVKSASC